MRMICLFLLLLFMAPLTIQAAVEQPLLKDQSDQLNYSLGYHLGERLSVSGQTFDPDLLWRALNEGLLGLEPQQASADYALGFNLGQEILRHKLEFRGEALWQGLYDLIDQAPLRIPAAEMSQMLEEIRGIPGTVVQTQAGAASEPAPQPKVYRLPGQKFLAENIEKKDIISLPSGLQYRVIKSGTGKTPAHNDSVVVAYEGKTTEGQVFSGFGIQTETFPVNKLMPGLTQALTMMREGDHWEVFMPTRLAFKDVGPMAGKTIIYDLELLEVLPSVQ